MERRYKFFDPNHDWQLVPPTLTRTRPIHADCSPADTGDIEAWLDGDVGKSTVDIPKAQVVFDTKIFFFEEEQPSLQRILVTDTTGFNNNFASGNGSIPKATAAATQSTVTLNSFNDQFQVPQQTSIPRA